MNLIYTLPDQWYRVQYSVQFIFKCMSFNNVIPKTKKTNSSINITLKSQMTQLGSICGALGSGYRWQMQQRKVCDGVGSIGATGSLELRDDLLFIALVSWNVASTVRARILSCRLDFRRVGNGAHSRTIQGLYRFKIFQNSSPRIESQLDGTDENAEWYDTVRGTARCTARHGY